MYDRHIYINIISKHKQMLFDPENIGSVYSKAIFYGGSHITTVTLAGMMKNVLLFPKF